MINQGKVPLHFNIPPLRETCYTVSNVQGNIQVKESLDIDVLFKPTSPGRFANSLIIECKGVSYKEVVIVGVGGQMKLDIFPPKADIGILILYLEKHCIFIKTPPLQVDVLVILEFIML